MKYVYMNERIRQKAPRRPVIVCQEPEAILEANHFTLRLDGRVIGRIVFDRRGLDACKTHEVRAWVELHDEVNVIANAQIITERWYVEPGTQAKLERVQTSTE